MSKLNVVRRCYNCGAILQDEHPDKPGFINHEYFVDNATVLFCDKCWQRERYSLSLAPREPNITADFLDMLRDAQASDALIVYVVDLFSFEASFVKSIISIISGLKILIIANKRDLLPASADDSNLREYVAHRFRVAGLRVKGKDVVLTSLTAYTQTKSLSERINKIRRGHDVYIIGAIGAGKTLFLSAFLRNYNNASRHNIVTAAYPGTSLRVMQIPLDSSSSIYDTPGTSLDNSIITRADIDASRVISPSEQLGKRTLLLSKGDGLFIGGLARIDLIEGGRQKISCYFSSAVEIKRASKSHNSDSDFFKGIEKGALHPILACATTAKDFDVFDIQVESETGPRDIGIEGLGWISFVANKQTFRICAPKGVAIYTTRAKVKYANSKK